VVLVHGGVGPELTWERQAELAERWNLVVPTRAGFPGGPQAMRQDFERDAEDLAALLDHRAHLVGHSYGGVACAIVAGDNPERVTSLTLVESPIYKSAPDHPAVREIITSGDAVLASDADEDTERRFLANAGMDTESMTGRHRELIERAIDAARGGRSPSEADPELDAIARADMPVMVVSGAHHAGIEMVCDGLAGRLNARRETVPRAGHAVPRATGFNEVLEDFLRESAGTARSRKG
jgi:pimeloyl-ACP methyl ester carboxylesterase